LQQCKKSETGKDENKIKINLRMAHKISLASYFQIIFFFLFFASPAFGAVAFLPPFLEVLEVLSACPLHNRCG